MQLLDRKSLIEVFIDILQFMQEKAGSKGYRIVACNGRVAIMGFWFLD